MKIAVPPRTTNHEGNLTKQFDVFRLCYDTSRDHAIHTPLDCENILRMVHSKDHMARAFSDLDLNGFGGSDRRKVWHAMASVSAFVGATSAALSRAVDGKAVAFAPVSGFHHAGPNRMGGYCTFNGLMAASLFALSNGAHRVLIVDGDGHFGDGTEDCIEEMGMGKSITNLWIANKDAPMKNIGAYLVDVLPAYDLVLYQAGADAHIDDPYGAGYLTAGEWISRDRAVFSACRAAAVPIVWNLAGGYNGAKTLDLHTSTFETAVEVFYNGEQRAIARGASVAPELEPGAVPDEADWLAPVRRSPVLNHA